MDLYTYIIRREFDRFSNFRKYILDSIENERKKKSCSWEEFKEGEGKNIDITEEEYDDHISDEYITIDDTEQLLYKSYLVSIFIFLEQQFADLCDFINDQKKAIFTYKDLKGIGIQRSINYIHKTLGKPFPILEARRKKFETALAVRNLIVHLNGELEGSRDGDKQKINDYVMNHKDLKNVHGHIQITQTYIENVTGIAQGVCGEIFQIRESIKLGL